MTYTMFFNMLLNIGLLVMIAMCLTEFPPVQKMILGEDDRLRSRIGLALIFGAISIVSTYTGTRTHGAIVNTRVIGVLAAGLLGGPWAGMGAALIGGLHRYLFDIGGFTALSCAVSTLAEGLVGSLFSRQFQMGKIHSAGLFLLTAATEMLQMLIILLISRPFQAALTLVSQIAVPMILMNSVGMLIFMQTFDIVLIKRDGQLAEQMRLALGIVEKCLPHLQKGFYSRKDMEAAAEIIFQAVPCRAVLITDTRQIIASRTDSRWHSSELVKPRLFAAMQEATPVCIDQAEADSPIHGLLKKNTLMVAPLTETEQPIGSLTIIVRKQWHTARFSLYFATELARLFSIQMELSNLEYQKKLRRKAELKALQSQVNPHFLYNALNTISCICQENPSRAQMLILALSSYYRQTLETQQEMLNLHTELYHVNTYLELEKARFEEKLHVDIQVEEDLDCMIPPFILQPLVENAIRYGMDRQGFRKVTVTARREGDESHPLVRISVCDRGQGFAPDIDIAGLLDGTGGARGVGLRNVHQRLKAIYGNEYGLHIDTGPDGSCVWFQTPILQRRPEQ